MFVCVMLETKHPSSIWNVMIVSLWNSWLFQNGHKSHFVKYDGEITSEFCFDFFTENKAKHIGFAIMLIVILTTNIQMVLKCYGSGILST